MRQQELQLQCVTDGFTGPRPTVRPTSKEWGRLRPRSHSSPTGPEPCLEPMPSYTSCTGSRLFNGDVLNILGFLADSKEIFDVCIADPPYNIGKDFGNNNDDLPLEEYVKWSRDWIDLTLSLLSRDGILYIYGFTEILAHVAVNYPLDQQRWLVWHYTNKTVPTSKFWQRSHESILALWNNEKPKLHVDDIREPYTQNFLRNSAGKKRKQTTGRFSKDDADSTYQAHANGALPRDVLKIPALAGGAGRTERWFMCISHDRQVFPPSELTHHRSCNVLKHPTQKPSALTERLLASRIQGSSGRLLVPFTGSGSECVVAQKLGVPFVGIELNPEFVEFSQKWLTATGDA